MNANDRLPALRAIDVVPIRRPTGEMALALRDPTQLSPQTLVISPAGYLVLMHLDGRHSVADVQAAYRTHAGWDISEAEVGNVVRALDEALLLAGPRAEAALAQRRADYAAAPVRDSRANHPAPGPLRQEIETMIRRGVAAPVRDVRGIMAPHLDYARGAPCYADAYATLGTSPPADRFVILGTNHSGCARSAVATRKDFATPLGLAPVDREFLRRLESRLGYDLCLHEADHQVEHSIELQVHILQVLLDGRPFEIVPILCPDVVGPSGTLPADGEGPDLGDVAVAIGELAAGDVRRTVIIAAADLSHVGQRFGDDEPTTTAFLEAVAKSDRALLELLEQRREDEFVAELRASQNKTRICSSGCIYALLRALPNHPCRILGYHQAADLESETSVTCAAAVVGQ